MTIQKNSTWGGKEDAMKPIGMRLPVALYKRAQGEAVEFDMKMWRFFYALLVYYFSASAEIQREIREIANVA